MRAKRVVLGLSIVAVLSACVDSSRSVDSGELAITLTDGSGISSVQWTITGGSLEAPLSGQIRAEGPDETISTRISSIPVGTGYVTELTAVDSDGHSCAGQAPFDIPSAGSSVFVAIVIECGGGAPGDTGDVVVDGDVNHCPAGTTTVSPLEAPVGGTIGLSTEASDHDGDTVTYRWSAATGDFADPTAAATTYTCAVPGTTTLTLTLDDGFSCDVTRDVDVTCVAAPDPDVEYTAGHGDIAFEFTVTDGAFEVLVEAEGATIDGVPDVDGQFDVDGVRIVTDATFTRPTADGGVFDALCVGPGEAVSWLPQGNGDAASLGVPFVGIAAEVASGVFVDDRLTLELVSVASPSGTGAYSLWKDGFPPNFAISSCDGIDGSDALSLPIGHDHFNMGFADTMPGLWDVTYRVSGELASDGTTPAAQFTVTFEVR